MKLLGFNDLWFMIPGIPLVAFIIPAVFFGESVLPNFSSYCTTFSQALLFTAMLWIGNRGIVMWSRKRWLTVDKDRTRVIVQYLLTILFTLAFNVLGAVAGQYNSDYDARYLVSGIYASLFVTLFVSTVYEAVWYTSRWREARIEAANLRKENLQSQLAALRHQINPHFLFNSLNTLTAFVHENPDKAVEFIAHMSSMYRRLLENQTQDVVSVRDELNMLEHYVFLLKSRFEDKINISIEMDPGADEKMIVPYALQLTMENAIKHNVVSSKTPLSIRIVVSHEGIAISNNLQRKQQDQPSTGIGLENINQRYLLVTGQSIQVKQDQQNFEVFLPAISIKQHEGNHR
jgi:sensor histidine kinase YesM